MLDNLLVSRLPAFHSSRCLFTKPELPSFYPNRSITHPQRKLCQYMELYNSSMTFYNYMIFRVKIFTKIYIICGELANYNKFLVCPRLARSACPLLSCNPTVTSATDRPSKNISATDRSSKNVAGKYCHNSCQ